MKIGIISDIHGYPERFKKAMEYTKDCDIVLCAGDILYHGPRNPILEGYNPIALSEEIKKSSIPLLIVRGNCDAEVDSMVLDIPIFAPVIFYEKDGIRIIVMHGHDVDENKLKEIATYYKANIVITGHTHIRKYERIEQTIYINPGSISVPKGDGKPSLALLENNEIKFINIENGEVLEKYNI